MTWVCAKCKSRWPAMVTLEAFYNHKRAADIHPGEPCEEKK